MGFSVAVIQLVHRRSPKWPNKASPRPMRETTIPRLNAVACGGRLIVLCPVDKFRVNRVPLAAAHRNPLMS
jgi:hypothetical protein